MVFEGPVVPDKSLAKSSQRTAQADGRGLKRERSTKGAGPQRVPLLGSLRCISLPSHSMYDVFS